MSAPYVGKRVKVINTSVAELNGREGGALAFNSEKGRYLVQLEDGRQNWYKPQNLESIPGDLPAGCNMNSSGAGTPGANSSGPFNQAQYMEAQRQAQEMLSRLQSMLPPGVSPQAFLIAVLVLAVAIIYFLGFISGIPVIFTIGFFVVVGFPAFKSGGGGVPGIKNAVEKLSSTIQNEITSRIQRSIPPYIGKVILGFLVVYVIQSFVAAFTGSATSGSETFSSPLAEDSAYEAFKLGFRSAENGEEYSNPYTPPRQNIPAAGPPVASSSGGIFGSSMVSKFIPLLLIAKTVYDLGGQPFNPQMVMANFHTVPTWKKAIMAFAIVRLFFF